MHTPESNVTSAGPRPSLKGPSMDVKSRVLIMSDCTLPMRLAGLASIPRPACLIQYSIALAQCAAEDHE